MGVVEDITDRVRLVEELRESRARIVEAGARERLRLERDLHDGAQNRLVAIQISSRGRESRPAPVRWQPGSTRSSTTRRLRSRNCVRWGTASTRGSCASAASATPLRSLAATAPVRVRMIADGVGRHAPPVEEAVFFCAREAIQNATKHAGARAHVTLALERRDDGFEFEVADDGPGFDPHEQSGGFGLASMRDRIAAVGGELETITAPGQGARIRGTIPHRGAPDG